MMSRNIFHQTMSGVPMLLILLGALILYYLTTLYPLTRTTNTTLKVTMKKELLDETNVALSIYLGSRFLALLILCTQYIPGVRLAVAVIIGLVLQELFLILFEKVLGIGKFVHFILEKQNTSVALLYAFVIVGVSVLIAYL